MDRAARAGADDSPSGLSGAARVLGDPRERTGSGHAPVENADVATASDDYASRFAGSVGAWFLAEQARTTREMLADLPRGAQVLDVGGGHAQLTPMLLEAGYQVTVLGSGPGADHQLVPFLARGVRFETGSLVALPYGDCSFDAVLSFRLLPHVMAWRTLLSELCRTARRCVVVDYPSTRSINAIGGGLYDLKKSVERNTRRFTLFSPEEIAAAFGANGYRMADGRRQFLWPMVLHRMLGSAALAAALEAPGRWTGLARVFGSPVIVRAERRA